MNHTLTRACKPCIRAKKRCDRGLPRCLRCTDKGIECSYLNEPLRPSSERPKLSEAKDLSFVRQTREGPYEGFPNRRRFWRRPNGRILGIDAPTITQITDPAVFLPMDVDSLTDILKNLTLYPVDFVQKGGTDFIHPCSYRSFCPAPLQIAADICQVHAGPSVQERQSQSGHFRSSAQALLSTADSLVDFRETLAFVQSLCLLQILALFSPGSTKQIQAEGAQRQQLLKTWTEKLWASAPSELPHTLSMQEAYVLAEAVRRTIIVSHKIQGCYRVLRTGFFMHTIFVESLPFGRNSHLWESEVCLAKITTNDTELLSYREYCDLWDTGQIHTPTPFERMLLVGCKGKAAVDERLGQSS